MAQQHKSKPARIPEIEGAAADERTLRFSFKHLDTRNPKFDPSKCTIEYFCKLFAILQRFSTWTVAQFVDQDNEDRRHIIDFAKTSEIDGFQNIPEADRDQFAYSDGWQFGVYPEVRWNDWRVHGILLGDTFMSYGLIRNISCIPSLWPYTNKLALQPHVAGLSTRPVEKLMIGAVGRLK